jgi:hypothetical protein
MSPPTIEAPPPPLGDRLAAFLAAHPRYYLGKDVLAEVFDDNGDAFIDAYCMGLIPTPMRRICEEELGSAWLQVGLLRRVSRQLSALLAALQ